MSDKQPALEAMKPMSDKVSFREIEFLAVVRDGEEHANQGKLIPLEQLENNLQTWLLK